MNLLLRIEVQFRLPVLIVGVCFRPWNFCLVTVWGTLFAI